MSRTLTSQFQAIIAFGRKATCVLLLLCTLPLFAQSQTDSLFEEEVIFNGDQLFNGTIYRGLATSVEGLVMFKMVTKMGPDSIFAGVTTEGVYVEKGVASYYGDEFIGRLTANGEIYSQEFLTCAHRSLPFNTILKVTRADNGHSVYVRVNDRGPFKPGRVVDLSRYAAKELGILLDGTTSIYVEVVKDESLKEKYPLLFAKLPKNPTANPAVVTTPKPAAPKPTPQTPKPTTPPTKPQTPAIVSNETPTKEPGKGVGLYDVSTLNPMGRYGVQVGAYYEQRSLLHGISVLESNGFSQTMFQTGYAHNTPVYRIIVGYEGTRAEAELIKARLKSQMGVDGMVVQLSNLQ